MEKINSFYRKMAFINRITTMIGGGLLLLVTFFIFFDVFLRYLFNRPSIWITEVSTYMFLYIIFLGTAYTLQQDQHISVGFLLDLLGPRFHKIIPRITSLIGMIFCFVFMWQTGRMAWKAYQEEWVSPTMLAVPLVWLYLVMVFGSAALFLTYLLKTIGQAKGQITKN